MSPITVIVPYPELREMCLDIVKSSPLEFNIYEALCEEALPIARQALQNGSKVIISRGETTLMLRSALGKHEAYILDIPITDCDRLSMLTKALEYGKKVAIAGFSVSLNMSLIVPNILSEDVTLKFYRISRVEDIDEICVQIARDGFNIIAGTPRAISRATEYGMIGIPLLSERSTVELVMADAQRLHGILVKNQRLKTVGEYHERSRTMLFDKAGDLLFDNTSIDEQCRLTISAEAAAAKGTRDVYGNIGVAEGILHYIITPVEDPATGIGACCHVCLERVTPQISMTKSAGDAFAGIITANYAMRQKLDFLRGIAATDATIMIYGESGTGKSKLAEAVHNASPRAGKPFISFNCATIPETLIESELFGYCAGAFTGANRKGKKGYFAMAHGGTIFLDEINELSLSAQAKALKFFEEKNFYPVGSTEPVSVDVRIICATNKPLQELMERGTFRRDLYYRLSVFEVLIPPLRDRPEDIAELAARFAVELGVKYNCHFKLTGEILERLKDGEYPGNVRQLKNIMERMVVSFKLGTPLADCLENMSCKTPSTCAEASLRHMEEMHIRAVLNRFAGNKSLAANALGISKSTLWRKCREMNLGQQSI